MGTTISFNRPDGKKVDGYLAEPAGGANAPGIVVIQEWWGVNEQIRGVADRLATAGYRALVPDLYRGKSTIEAEEAHHLMTGLNFADAASQDIRGAVQFLKAHGNKVGVTGFCMGGALTLLAACMAPEIHASVVWYGCPPRICRRHQDQGATSRALGHPGRVFQDRDHRSAGGQAPRGGCGL
jgi:carboxymethylenebutenolidase